MSAKSNGLRNDTHERAHPFALPGQGEQPLGCGEELMLYCPDCGHHFEVESKCNRSTCPNCWRSWAHQLARRSSLRIWSGSKFKMKGRRWFRLLHCVVSLPASSLSASRKQCIKIAKNHGIIGGLMVFHPFRKGAEDRFVPDGYHHFHIIGLAPGNVKPGNDNGKYIFKVIKDAKTKDYKGFRRPRDICACVFYLLTHCGISENRHSLTWFGALSYNQFNNDTWAKNYPELMEYLQPRARECPNCGGHNVENVWAWDLPAGFGVQEDYIKRPAYVVGLDEYG